MPRKHLGPHSLRTELRSISACPGGAITPQQALHPQPLKAKPKGSASSSFHPAVQSHWQTLGALPPDRPPHHPPTKSLCLPPKPADSPADPSVTSKMQLGPQASSTTPSAVSPIPGLSGLPERAQGRFLCLEALPRLFPLPGGAAPSPSQRDPSGPCAHAHTPWVSSGNYAIRNAVCICLLAHGCQPHCGQRLVERPHEGKEEGIADGTLPTDPQVSAHGGLRGEHRGMGPCEFSTVPTRQPSPLTPVASSGALQSTLSFNGLQEALTELRGSTSTHGYILFQERIRMKISQGQRRVGQIAGVQTRSTRCLYDIRTGSPGND